MSESRDQFSAWAEQYDDALHQGLRLSGERKEYFARGRVEWLKRQLAARHFHPKNILDFGCGTGTSTPLLREAFQAEAVLGVDVSDRSLEVARERNAGPGIVYENSLDRAPSPRFDLAFCNGVFHHIPPAQRAQALSYIRQSLVPGGWLAFWENNPWNPGTRWVMSRIPFDRDAITLTPPEARQLLTRCGFHHPQLRFLFIFPHVLRAFRFLEPYLARFPLGAQYQVLCQRP